MTCYVIGGNEEQALYYVKRKKLFDAVVVNDPNMLRSLRSPQVILTGTYLIRDDVQLFESVLNEIEAEGHFDTA